MFVASRRYIVALTVSTPCCLQTFRVMDTISWAEVTEVRDAMSPALDSRSVSSMCGVDWSVDGKWVAVGSAGGGIHVLGTSSWHLLAPSLDNLSFTDSKINAAGD